MFSLVVTHWSEFGSTGNTHVSEYWVVCRGAYWVCLVLPYWRLHFLWPFKAGSWQHCISSVDTLKFWLLLRRAKVASSFLSEDATRHKPNPQYFLTTCWLLLANHHAHSVCVRDIGSASHCELILHTCQFSGSPCMENGSTSVCTVKKCPTLLLEVLGPWPIGPRQVLYPLSHPSTLRIFITLGLYGYFLTCIWGQCVYICEFAGVQEYLRGGPWRPEVSALASSCLSSP